ncbi:MAG: lytic murein transglycosylase B [Gammaproteobacteria bacterium]
MAISKARVHKGWLAGLPMLLALGQGCAAALEIEAVTDHPSFAPFIQEMVDRHGFDANQLTELFANARMHPGIIKAISHPAEAKPWYQYRRIFLTPGRIDGGIAYWNRHSKILAAAKERYGVDPRVIVAIIGVETSYGRNDGSYRILDSLSTLAFGYPPRAQFFRGELEQFLLLSREEQVDPLTVTGSYAGAMGQGQFIPSSYRRYAVDFDEDGKRDLWDSPSDIIGSIANYLHKHGWEPGQLVVSPVRIHGVRYRTLLRQGLKPHISLAKIRQYGVDPLLSLPNQRLAMLVELETPKGSEYWLGLNNFYVITRYNHSALYAMAVHQLSEEIEKQREIVNNL